MSGDCKKVYWRSHREVNPLIIDSDGTKGDVAQWIENSPSRFDRRSFLKAAGFTLALGNLVGCGKAPVNKAIPLMVQEEGFVPGRAEYFSTVCGACSAGCGMMVRRRDSRPIKLEGLPDHPMSAGGLCAIGQASLLGLYDSKRFSTPQKAGQEGSWADIDSAIAAKLNEIKSQGGAVRFLSYTINSPTEKAVIQRFLSTFSNARHIVYDPLSSSAILDAHQKTHGLRTLPRYHFEKANIIVSFDADFLGTWISPVEFAAGYRTNRNLETSPANLSLHVQVESRMSLTGTKADKRYRVAPGDLGLVFSHLAMRVVPPQSSPIDPASLGESPVPAAELDHLAGQLINARGKSLIVSGSQDVAIQSLCNLINHHLDNYGKTLDLTAPSYQKQGNDTELTGLIQELNEGKVAALFVYGVNPVYELPQGKQLAEALKQVSLVVDFAERANETSALAHFNCPVSHYLESWGDREPAAGVAGICQPILNPLFDTRPLIESLSIWMGTPQSPYDTIRTHWQENIHPRAVATQDFRSFWDQTLHDGFTRVNPTAPQAATVDLSSVHGVPSLPNDAKDSFTLVLYPKVGLNDGRHAYNPWLQELPDPVSKVTWDNYACLSVAASESLGVDEGDVVKIEVGAAGGNTEFLELPVYVQPGQHDSVVAVALGYGQVSTKRFADIGPNWLEKKSSVGDDGLVGKNVSPFLSLEDGGLRYVRQGVAVTKTGRTQPLACTQTHHTITVPPELAPAGALRRPIVQETTLAAFLKDPTSGQHHIHIPEAEIYPAEDHPYTGHRWGMAIDLTTCSGCSACVTACQVENNIPVVGKDEVHRRRDMHWMRIDRYYSGEGDEVDVIHQPMLCQHCENASCENVCPVLATVHTSEGLNAQVYNRCVGTRYCANNCAYKVRRFNWFNYPHEDPIENLVLNPDVVVRSRGIMEKCSFCVQRIEEAKIESKRLGQPLADSMVKPACQQSCPMQAIVFGDINDPNSRIAKLIQSPRQFRVLEEIDVRPSINYLTLVRNRTEEEGSAQHG